MMRPAHLVSKVINALKEVEGLPGATVDTSVRGFGKGRAAGAPGRIVDDFVEYVPKAKLEIVVPDTMVQDHCGCDSEERVHGKTG